MQPCHGVDTKTEINVDFRPIIAKLAQDGWNICIYDHCDPYVYVKTARNGGWRVLATKNQALDLVNPNELAKHPDVIQLEIIKETGDIASLTWQNHGEAAFKTYQAQVDAPIREALAKCCCHYHLEGAQDPVTTAFFVTFADAMASIVGHAKCGKTFDTYTLVDSPAKARDEAEEAFRKLLKRKKKEALDMEPEAMLAAIQSERPERVVTYDPERIESAGDYAAVLQLHADQCKLKLKSVTDTLDAENKTAAICFKKGKETFEWHLAQPSNWVSIAFYEKLTALVEAFTKGTLVSVETDDQTTRCFYLEKAIAAYFVEVDVCGLLY